MSSPAPIDRKSLRLGIFMPPWLLPIDRDPTIAIREVIQMIEFAEHAGFQEAWVGEHHNGGMEIVASPELLLAAAVERTHSIKLGTGVISLPYHNPMMVADRIVQLDHQSRGRCMFGFGPGLLPGDAKMLGIPSTKQRDRLSEGLDVVLRLLAGETVTKKTEWFELNEAHLQIGPHSHPRPEVLVASAITPSGGKTAGKYGLGLLCVAAASPAGFDVLDTNWKIAMETAEEHGNDIDASMLRLVAPTHIAPTEEQAFEEIAAGFGIWDAHQRSMVEGGAEVIGLGSLDDLKKGAAIVGTVDYAVERLEDYWQKTGGFGCLLLQMHPWASPEDTRRSMRMWTEEILPRWSGRTKARHASHDWASSKRQLLAAEQKAGIDKALSDHFGADKPAEGAKA